MRTELLALTLAVAPLGVLMTASCGARTDLEGESTPEIPVVEAGATPPLDAPRDVPPADAPHPPDRHDAEPDAPRPDLCSPDGKPFTVATGVDGTDYQIALDATYVYFTGATATAEGPLRRVPKGGGPVETLAPSGGQYYGQDATFLYWGDGSTMSRVARASGAIDHLGPLTAPLLSIAVDDTDIYWASIPFNQPAVLMRMSKSGGTATALPIANADAVVVDAAGIYWTDEKGHLFGMPKSGGPPTMLSDDHGALNVVEDEGSLYFLNTAGGGLAKVAKRGGPVTVLVSGALAFSIAVDRDFVYWADPFDSTVHKVPKSGGAATLLGTGARSSAASIAVDDACVYWIDGSNEVEAELVRVAK